MMNLERIAQVAAQECVRQQVGLAELSRLIDAYRLVAQSNCPFQNTVDIEWLGMHIEPIKNRNGFRAIPVTFQNGGSSAPAIEIPRLMANLADMVKNPRTGFNWDRTPFTIGTDDIVKEFLWIHPFVDANGRVAWILYNWLNGTMDEPENLPDYFGEGLDTGHPIV